jgi:hypothetical protein
MMKTLILVLILLIAGFLIWHWSSFSKEKSLIDRLQPKEVSAIFVQDSTGTGPGVRITNQQTIDRVLGSLKSGRYYLPSHDQIKGFERTITLEPDGFKFTTYRKAGSPEAVVVCLSQGRLVCTPFSAWSPVDDQFKQSELEDQPLDTARPNPK